MKKVAVIMGRDVYKRQRLYAPLYVEDGMDWRELNMAVSKAMQNYCGGIKCSALLELSLIHI